MKVVKFDVNDDAVDVVVGVLTHLEHLSETDTKRVIRIGGDEKTFDGSIHEVLNIEVDGARQTGYTSSIPDRLKKDGVSQITSPVTPVPSVSQVQAATRTGQQATGGATVSNQQLEQLVDKVLTDFVNGQGLFTAYDVTKALRADGVQCRHRDVRRIVHETYINDNLDPDYDRSLIFVKSGTQAFVYHPEDVDPNAYRDGDGDNDAATDSSSPVTASHDPLNDLD